MRVSIRKVSNSAFTTRLPLMGRRGRRYYVHDEAAATFITAFGHMADAMTRAALRHGCT